MNIKKMMQRELVSIALNVIKEVEVVNRYTFHESLNSIERQIRATRYKFTK